MLSQQEVAIACMADEEAKDWLFHKLRNLGIPHGSMQFITEERLYREFDAFDPDNQTVVVEEQSEEEVRALPISSTPVTFRCMETCTFRGEERSEATSQHDRASGLCTVGLAERISGLNQVVRDELLLKSVRTAFCVAVLGSDVGMAAVERYARSPP